MAGGRPTDYDPKYCQELIDHMKGGLSFESFAALADVNRDTLYEWVKVHPEFSDAKKRGTDLNLIWWERIGRAAMLGHAGKDADGKPIPLKNFNATLWIFNMKNRHGWRDKQEHDHTHHVEPFVVETSDGEKTTMGAKK
jgi:hypothetical protein